MSGQVVLYFDDQADALRFALAAGSVMAGEGAKFTNDLVEETARVTRIRLDAVNAGNSKKPNSGPAPGRRRVLVSYFRAAGLRCQARSVAGVTGKILAHRRRGMNGASAANQARSAGSYRIRPAVRRSTTFSCRSTSSSASFA